MRLRRSLCALAFLPMFGVLLAGCATSRSEIRLPGTAAATPTTSQASTGRAVVIRSVKDERVFEQAPRTPSTPSLGFEGALQASDEVKARAVARKRGGFGQAMGDVLLEKGQTVTGLVKENLAAAFVQAGYRVVDDTATAGPAPLVVDVRVKQFWAWFQPGFWAITLNANIETSIEATGSPLNVNVHAEESRQLATDSAWLEIVEKALGAYRNEAAAKLARPSP